MSELLKREASFTVLRVRLSETRDISSSTPPASSTGDTSVISTEAASAQSSPPAVMTSAPRVTCELEVTGNAHDRGLALPAGHATDLRADLSIARTVAQWNFAAAEVQLPVQFTDAVRFRDRPNLAGELMANFTRAAVATIFAEFKADALERYASTKNWLPSGKPMLPSTMMQQLKNLLPSLLGENDSLWLELADSAGYLSLLPWEEMLQSVTSAPTLRLSPHSLKALSPNRELSVVLCVTVPAREWLPSIDQLTALARSIRESLPARSKLHVFADDVCHDAFAAATKAISSDDQGRAIMLYDLPGSAPGNDAEKENPCDQPWMNWIMNSLSGCAVDIVHCFSPGLLFPDHPRLVISRDANARVVSGEASAAVRLLGYVTPLEHNDMLTSLGAWAAIFSAPLGGPESAQSRLGLRLFVDRLARLRPGVAVFHDFEADPKCESLAQTYKFMIGDSAIQPAKTTSVVIYCHPARATNVPAQTLPGSDELMKQYAKVEEKIQSAIEQPGPTPVWVAATQRIVEQAMSSIASVGAKEPDNAAVRGVVSALKHVDEMLAEQLLTSPALQSEATGAETEASHNG